MVQGDGYWGAPQGNGSWNGMIGMVLRKVSSSKLLYISHTRFDSCTHTYILICSHSLSHTQNTVGADLPKLKMKMLYRYLQSNILGSPPSLPGSGSGTGTFWGDLREESGGGVHMARLQGGATRVSTTTPTPAPALAVPHATYVSHS